MPGMPVTSPTGPESGRPPVPTVVPVVAPPVDPPVVVVPLPVPLVGPAPPLPPVVAVVPLPVAGPVLPLPVVAGPVPSLPACPALPTGPTTPEQPTISVAMRLIVSPFIGLAIIQPRCLHGDNAIAFAAILYRRLSNGLGGIGVTRRGLRPACEKFHSVMRTRSSAPRSALDGLHRSFSRRSHPSVLRRAFFKLRHVRMAPIGTRLPTPPYL